jgi:ribose transport system permease protein
VLRNLVNLLDIPGSLDFAVMGAVILMGVIADQILRPGLKTKVLTTATPELSSHRLRNE